MQTKVASSGFFVFTKRKCLLFFRRFNYISKILYSLFSHDRLIQLPGNAQKVLFKILEEMADTVYRNNYNEHVLRKLLDELHATMTIYHVRS